MDYNSPFWGPKAISKIVEPQGELTCRSSTLVVFVDLTRFVDYYSHFWGPKAISMIVETYGALTCRPSTVAVLADSGPFRALLLTILES